VEVEKCGHPLAQGQDEFTTCIFINEDLSFSTFLKIDVHLVAAVSTISCPSQSK
jgi:hypothetical protein